MTKIDSQEIEGRILVTGANGMIGSALLTSLVGREVIGTSFRDTPEGKFPFYRADLTSPSETRSLIGNVKPDTIIHCAAISNLDQCEEDKGLCHVVNVTATGNLIEAKGNSHFIHLSTDMIFDGSEGPYYEDAPPSPINEYGRSKALAEEVVRTSSSWAIIRTALVYGARKDTNRSNIVDLCRNRFAQGERLRLVRDQMRTPTFLPDLIWGIAEITRRRSQGVYHIAGEEVVSPFDIGVKVADFLGVSSALLESTATSDFPQPAKRPLRCGLYIDRAKKELGFNPTSLGEGIRAVLSCY